MEKSAKNLDETSLIDLFSTHEKFVKCLLDSWALVDTSGKIVKCNPLFAQLLGESSRKVLKAASLDNLIRLSILNRNIGIQDLLEYRSSTRIDEVTASTDKRQDITLIIGIFPFISAEDHHLGSFLNIRDVTDDKALLDKYKSTKTDSITDQLTGLYTRRYFESYLEVANSRSSRDDEPPEKMSVIMIDIDHFKSINDDHGHQAGDAILKNMGEIIGNSFRKSDVTCRYGGEEFIVILPGTDKNGAVAAAEGLRKKVEQTKNIFQGKNIPITISCGVSMFNFERETPEKTIHRADEALYSAKESGRNQVQCADH